MITYLADWDRGVHNTHIERPFVVDHCLVLSNVGLLRIIAKEIDCLRYGLLSYLSDM